MSTSLWIRVDVKPGGRLGPGKIALLHAIHEHKSISAAARSLSMSYRRAWVLIDDLNKTFGKPVVETSIGGREHGGAKLTQFGQELIELYQTITVKAHDSTVAERARIDALLSG